VTATYCDLLCFRFQGVTTSGFKEEPLPDDGDDEAPQEDHVVQLRCVLEIMNTGARRFITNTS